MSYIVAIYIPGLNGLPVVIGVAAVAIGVALGQLLAISLMRRHQAKNLQIAREKGQISQDGLVINTYSKMGTFRKGYLLVDEDTVMLQDKNREVTHSIKRKDIESVEYVKSAVHNFSFIFNLRDGSSLRVFTFRPAKANPYVVRIANELQATPLA